MRVAHLVWGGELVGSQLVALELARAARTAGHDVSFVSPAHDEFCVRAHAEGFAVDVVRLGSALDVAAMLRLRGVLRRRRIELLHTHVLFSLNVLARVAARSAGAVVVAHMHSEDRYRAGRSGRLQLLLDNATARLCRAIIAVSEATRAALVAQGYPADRITVVHNGVAPGGAAKPLRVDGVPPEPPVVLHVGRLNAVKGQRELIDALVRLEREDVVVVLVGEDVEAGGSYRRELERRAREHGIADRVVFAGRRDDVPSLLAGASVVALPSHVEGLPLVVLEAMAAGVPVVATDVGGTPEVVRDGENGLLVRPGDVDGLRRALDALLSDPELAQRLGRAGAELVSREFSLASTTERVLRLYGTR